MDAGSDNWDSGDTGGDAEARGSFGFFEPFLGYPVIKTVPRRWVFVYGDLVNPPAVAELRGNHVALVRGIVSVSDANFVHLRKSWFHWRSIGDRNPTRKREIPFPLGAEVKCRGQREAPEEG